MDIPILKSDEFKGYFLRFDPERETLSLFNSEGSFIKTVKLDELAGFLMESRITTRRKKLRTSISIKVNYQTQTGPWNESITGTLGTGGLFIETPTPLDKGTDLTVKFFLPDTPLRTIEAKGKVVWTRAQFEKVLHFPGMGVEFTDISPEEEMAIRRMVQSINKSRGVE